MEKKLYCLPQTEVVSVEGTCNVMKTSIDLLGDMSPRRRTPVF